MIAVPISVVPSNTSTLSLAIAFPISMRGLAPLGLQIKFVISGVASEAVPGVSMMTG